MDTDTIERKGFEEGDGGGEGRGGERGKQTPVRGIFYSFG